MKNAASTVQVTMLIDNYALSTFQTCPIKYKLRIVDGWTGKGKSAALGFGGAFHDGLAAWYRTHDREAGLAAIEAAWPMGMPSEDYRTLTKCLTTFKEYVREYPDETFQIIGYPDSPMVECTFNLDTGMYLNCYGCGRQWDGTIEVVGRSVIVEGDSACLGCGGTLEPVEWGGIFDGLIEFAGTIYVFEHKTTSVLGGYYFNQFKPNQQVTGYVWAGGQLGGKQVGGAMINAIGVYKAGKTKFERRITSRSPHEIAEWLRNVRNSCQQIKDCERRGVWPMYTHSCSMYSGCEFHSIHELGTEIERAKLLEQNFIQDTWSHETREGVKES